MKKDFIFVNNKEMSYFIELDFRLGVFNIALQQLIVLKIP